MQYLSLETAFRVARGQLKMVQLYFYQQLLCFFVCFSLDLQPEAMRQFDFVNRLFIILSFTESRLLPALIAYFILLEIQDHSSQYYEHQDRGP